MNEGGTIRLQEEGKSYGGEREDCEGRKTKYGEEERLIMKGEKGGKEKGRSQAGSGMKGSEEGKYRRNEEERLKK